MLPRVALLTALAISVSTPALATPSTDDAVITATVDVADLDLAAARDRDRLDIRLRSAVNSLCHPGGRALADIVRAQRCRATALASATPQVERAVAMAQRNQRLALLTLTPAR